MTKVVSRLSLFVDRSTPLGEYACYRVYLMGKI